MGVFYVLSFTAAIFFLGMHRGQCAKIVRGRVSVPHSRPYMAAIVRGNEIYCGGTLILENWVLTAAHCEIYIGDKVILGAHSLGNNEKEKQVFRVINLIRPENYNQKTKQHDIMLLQLNGKAWINTSVKTVHLPTTNEDVRAGTRCLVIGWGETHTGKASDVLQEITATIINRQVCNNNYYDTGLIITTNQLCASVLDRNGGPCPGDSGGPLICGGIQRGIISFRKNKNCNVRTAPDVYTRLTTAHIQWIKKSIRG